MRHLRLIVLLGAVCCLSFAGMAFSASQVTRRNKTIATLLEEKAISLSLTKSVLKDMVKQLKQLVWKWFKKKLLNSLVFL